MEEVGHISGAFVANLALIGHTVADRVPSTVVVMMRKR